jgi:hypothetical protein
MSNDGSSILSSHFIKIRVRHEHHEMGAKI